MMGKIQYFKPFLIQAKGVPDLTLTPVSSYAQGTSLTCDMLTSRDNCMSPNISTGSAGWSHIEASTTNSLTTPEGSKSTSGVKLENLFTVF